MEKQEEKDIKCIIATACEVAGISLEVFLSHKKNALLNAIRGVCYVLSRDRKIHPGITCRYMNRTRGNVITMCSVYRGYIRTRDATTMKLYREMLDKLS